MSEEGAEFVGDGVFDQTRIVWHGWLAATLAMLSRHPLVADQRPAFAARVEQKARAATRDGELPSMPPGTRDANA
ncbi:hypothetical protein [Catenulispora subtropica]|uniref:Uncharacterized protein n=1 Tax=Catenulispora subtropica TaxID=450798 RepID=A0ABN2SYQ3_9ACTN